jgi:hypothetical protein
MATNAKKFSDKMSNTWQFHLLAVAGFGLGIFFPVPALITFAICAAAAGIYEIYVIDKDEKDKGTYSGTAKNMLSSLWSSAKVTPNNARTAFGIQSAEQGAINEGVGMFCSLDNRHVAMLSVFTGFALGIGLGMIAAAFSPALATVIGASVIGTAAIGITTALYWKGLNEAIKVKPDSGSTPSSSANDKGITPEAFAKRTAEAVKERKNPNSVASRKLLSSLLETQKQKAPIRSQ